MKHIKMENCSINTIYSGVYKITFPNNKVYIGISNNIYKRMLEHNTDFRNNLPIEYAIKKYGIITEFDILEEINPENRKEMREKEKYWISFFNSNKKEFGYNISEGGDGADLGSNNNQAKLTEEQYQEVFVDLKDDKMSLADIAIKYKMDLSSISRLNNGHTYFHSSIIYPIRKTRPTMSGIKNINSNLSLDDLNSIYNLLQYNNEISMKQISQKFGVDATVIQNINIGKTYINNNFNYPLRESKTGKRKLNDDQVLHIINEIKKNPNESLASIGRRLNFSSKTISSINCGTTYRQDTEKYPIR